MLLFLFLSDLDTTFSVSILQQVMPVLESSWMRMLPSLAPTSRLTTPDVKDLAMVDINNNIYKILRILTTLVSYLVIAIFFCGHMIVSGDWVVVVAIIITRKINISSSTILHQIFAQSDRPCVSFDTEVSDRLYTGLSPRCVMMADFVSLSLR